ncbi:MAG: hypothetical protein KAT28_00260 [Candidatus Aenigmarchaeota archaeon]|nr:hypothetical protein [Candidatus Aenigmarchaeota archaeon]
MLEENKVHKETPLHSLIYGINPEDIYLENYFRLNDPLEQEKHRKLLFETASKFNGASIEPGKIAEIEYMFKGSNLTQKYESYILRPDFVGVIIGNSAARKDDELFKNQTVYVNSFNIHGENKDKMIKELTKNYSKKGAEIFPKINFTYDEIFNIGMSISGDPQRVSEGIDVALDIGYIERSSDLQERFINGNKVIAATYNIRPDVSKSLDYFATMVGFKGPPISPLPKHIYSRDLETEE